MIELQEEEPGLNLHFIDMSIIFYFLSPFVFMVNGYLLNGCLGVKIDTFFSVIIFKKRRKANG